MAETSETEPMDTRLRDLAIVAAIIGGALIWAGSLIDPPRFAVTTASSGVVFRVDTQTGDVVVCSPQVCRPVPQDGNTVAQAQEQRARSSDVGTEPVVDARTTKMFP